MAMAKDPVCGMMVDEARARWRSEHAGKAYHFCARACKERFDAAPERYAR